MKAIVWCEKSQILARALKRQGIDAVSCDILPCEHPEWGIFHIQDDALNHLEGYDLAIGHPDCTYLANSGVRWRIERQEWEQIRESAEFFNKLLNSSIPYLAIENPIQHKYARIHIRDYDQLIQPHYFIGSNESKATCLWLKNLPQLKRTQWLDKTQLAQSVLKEPPSINRKANRSRTFESIANAIALQWGNYLKAIKER